MITRLPWDSPYCCQLSFRFSVLSTKGITASLKAQSWVSPSGRETEKVTMVDTQALETKG